MGYTVVATVVAFAVALVVIGLFMRYISRGSFMPFVVYRVLLGIVIIVLLATGVLRELAEPQLGVAHRAARLYQFDAREYRARVKQGFHFEV